MPEIAPGTYSPLTTGSIVQDGTRNGDPPAATTFSRIADAINMAAGHRGRVLLSRRLRSGQRIQADGTNPLFRYRYHQDNENGTTLVYRVLVRPKGTTTGLNTNAPELRDAAGRVLQHRAFRATPAIPGSEWRFQGDRDIAPISGAAASRLMETVDGFDVASITVYERPGPGRPYSLDGANHHVRKAGLIAGRRIVDANALPDLSQTQEELWTRARDCFQTCQPLADPAGGGIGAPMTTTATTFTNLIDGTVARTTSTAGFPVSVLSGALGLRTSVDVQCSVYAQATPLVAGESGQVRLTSSLGSVDITGIAAANWYDAGSLLSVDTRAVNGDGRDWDKVDALGRVVVNGGTPGLRVWTVRIEVSPAL